MTGRVRRMTSQMAAVAVAALSWHIPDHGRRNRT